MTETLDNHFSTGVKNHKKWYEMFSNGKIQRMEQNSKIYSTVEDHHKVINVSSKARPATRSSTGANAVADDKTVCYFCQRMVNFIKWFLHVWMHV